MAVSGKYGRRRDEVKVGHFKAEFADPLDQPPKRRLVRQLRAQGCQTRANGDLTVFKFCAQGRAHFTLERYLVCLRPHLNGRARGSPSLSAFPNARPRAWHAGTGIVPAQGGRRPVAAHTLGEGDAAGHRVSTAARRFCAAVLTSAASFHRAGLAMVADFMPAASRWPAARASSPAGWSRP